MRGGLYGGHKLIRGIARQRGALSHVKECRGRWEGYGWEVHNRPVTMCSKYVRNTYIVDNSTLLLDGLEMVIAKGVPLLQI